MPTSAPSSSSTGKMNAEESAAVRRASSRRVSRWKLTYSGSSICPTRTAPRVRSTLVAVSCGERMIVTPAARAQCASLFLDGQIASDDDGVDARVDGAILNLRTIADEEDHAPILVTREPRGEGLRIHRTDHEEHLDGLA
jgi:hypothetical protein